MTSLLVDGCYTNNFPVEEVKEMGAGTIITVDVNALYEALDLQYGEGNVDLVSEGRERERDSLTH